MMQLRLSIPPGVNNLYANRYNGGGRCKSKRYRSWIETAGRELKLQRPQPMAGPVSIAIFLPETMRGDSDGRLKAPIDLLVTHHLIDGDARTTVRKSSAEFSVDVPSGQCIVTVTSAGEG